MEKDTCCFLLPSFSFPFLVRTALNLLSTSHRCVDVSHITVADVRFHVFDLILIHITAMIGYTIIVGQSLPKVFDNLIGESFLSDRHAVIAIMTVCVMLPLSLNKV